jgi:hypothetical protein
MSGETVILFVISAANYAHAKSAMTKRACRNHENKIFMN